MNDYSTSKIKSKKKPSEREIYQKTLQDLFSCRPVAYWPTLARKLGSVKAAVMLSQLLYWNGNKSAIERGGWFYKTVKELKEETGLSKYEQQTARKALVDLKAITAEIRGVPRKWHYRVNMKVIADLLQWEVFPPFSGRKNLPLKDGNPPTNGRETLPLAGGDPANYTGYYPGNNTGDYGREGEGLPPLPASSEAGVVVSSSKEADDLNVDACFIEVSKETKGDSRLSIEDPFKMIVLGIENIIHFHEVKFQFRFIDKYNEIMDITPQELSDEEFEEEREKLRLHMGPSCFYHVTSKGIEKIKSYFKNDSAAVDKDRLLDVVDFFYWYSRETENSLYDLTNLLNFYKIGAGELLVKYPEVYRQSQQVDLVRQVMGKEPPMELYPAIYEAVYEAVGIVSPYRHLVDAAECYREWRKRGHRKENFGWLFDWFALGTIPEPGEKVFS